MKAGTEYYTGVRDGYSSESQFINGIRSEAVNVDTFVETSHKMPEK